MCALSLNGHVGIVTGAGRGIGRAIALGLAKEGARLALVSRTPAELTVTAQLVTQLGATALPLTVDVSDPMDVLHMGEEVMSKFGPADILVNNAGVQGPIGPLVENDPAEWERTISTNILGNFHCTRAVLPRMMERRRGKIINLSGGGATAPRPNFSAYAVSKAAVVRMTETLAEELRPYNIQVNAIAPGAINTRMLDEVLAAGDAAGAEYKAAQKRRDEGGTPIELAAALVVFLASSASDQLTGKLISAPHDSWQDWDSEKLRSLSDSPWFTLRRIDLYTINPLIQKIQ